MDIHDIIYKTYSSGEKPDPYCFCHYGWEGIGSFAFWRFACAYYDSAEALYEKFVSSKGNFAITDGVGITMCFLYRHFVELSVKHLYVKFACKSEEEYKEFLNKNHNLYDLWMSVKPSLSENRKRVGSSVNIGVLEHYILEVDKFDKDSMTMRYPVTKDLKPTNTSTRLDIVNLHDRMSELYWAFYAIASDLENQLKKDVDQTKIDSFVSILDRLKDRVLWFLDEMKPYAEKEQIEFESHSFGSIDINDLLKNSNMHIFSSCTDDELMMLDTLYYTGRAIKSEELRLPKNPHEAKTDAIKMCILNMDRDGLEFGKPKNDGINIYGKQAGVLIECIQKSLDTIYWEEANGIGKASSSENEKA